MSIIESALQGLKKYADFKGRASRVEFWAFLGLVVILQAVAGFVGLLFRVGPMLSAIVSALLIIPQLAVAVRRLHDAEKRGRELLGPGLVFLALRQSFAFRGILPQT